MLNRRYGHDFLTASRLDGVGIAYITVCGTWTVLLFGGLGVLLKHRKLDFIRMRNPLLVASAVLLIHVYLCLVLLAYPLNGSYGCSAEFWTMSVYLPLGIACWHIANVQVLNMSWIQRELISNPKRLSCSTTGSKTISFNWRMWLRQTNIVTRTSIAVALALCLQLLASIIVFLCSRKFHPSYGIFSHATSQGDCRKGWSITVIGQALWTWAFGPIVLIQLSKMSDDVHKWRLQTSLAIVFSLPGLPLWLVAVYSSSFSKINAYWPASMWFAPGLMMMEFLPIYFPLLELYQRANKSRYYKIGMTKSEDRINGSTFSRETSLDDGSFEKPELRKVCSLEKVLGSEDFLQFAATKDFTAENIVFLRRVNDWKKAFNHSRLTNGSVNGAHLFTLYTEAASIFAETISLRTASYPVNIESKYYLALEQRFASASRYSDEELVAPFGSLESKEPEVTQRELGPQVSEFRLSKSMAALIGFDGHVFDEVERSVTYLVRTNTWLRYVSYLEKTANVSGSRWPHYVF